MVQRSQRPGKAYRNRGFLNSKDARPLRILAEYLEPKARFERHRVDDTVVFMGSARVRSAACSAVASAVSVVDVDIPSHCTEQRRYAVADSSAPPALLHGAALG